ncbi:hypothetical protein ABXS75_12120 [Roseburia hominis]
MGHYKKIWRLILLCVVYYLISYLMLFINYHISERYLDKNVVIVYAYLGITCMSYLIEGLILCSVFFSDILNWREALIEGIILVSPSLILSIYHIQRGMLDSVYLTNILKLSYLMTGGGIFKIVRFIRK